jgi:hypothetical protein
MQGQLTPLTFLNPFITTQKFFRANGGVLLYICATGDGMQKYR